MAIPIIIKADRLNAKGKGILVRELMSLARDGGQCSDCGEDLERPGASPFFACPNPDCPSKEKEIEKE